MSDAIDLDATGQAEAIAAGDVGAVELTEAALGRIAELNPAINAVIHLDAERAIDAARRVEPGAAPFAGVPFLLKDIGATQQGQPYWLGNRALRDMGNMSLGDTELGARFRSAGLVTLGKTNLPELGTSPSTQPLSCGPTRNPWDLSRSPAGSSGGSAAAVASGMVAIAHANDGGGSTRLPASWCGLVGLKTTRGRVPNPLNASRLTSELVVTRSVRDTARLLDAVEGAVPADLFQLARPEVPYSTLGDPPSGLRVAVLAEAADVDVDPECVAAVEATARELEALGHRVEPVAADALFGGDSSVNGRLWMGGIARRIDMLSEYAGRTLTADDVEPYNWTAAVRGRQITAAELAQATEVQQAWSAGVVQWLSNYDLLLTPTSGCPPLRTDEMTPPDDKPWKIAATYARVGVFTLPFNVTGNPAISLPLHQTAEGLPVGVQLVAGMGREDVLLQIASVLEQAVGWTGRAPAVV